VLSEMQVMYELERMVGRPIPPASIIHWRSFGFEANAGRIIKLAIYNQGITQIPETIGQLKKLQELYLGHNKLTHLPESLGNLYQLRTLTLEHNELTSVPDNLGQLQKLHTLDLSANQLKSLPIAFYTMKSLRMIDLGGNQNLRIPLLVERWLVGIRQKGGTIFR